MPKTELKKCKKCHKDFKYNYLLQVHMLSHKKQSSFKCKMCERTFTQRGNMHTHLWRVHGESNGHIRNIPQSKTSKNRLKCENCEAYFLSKNSLQNHLEQNCSSLINNPVKLTEIKEKEDISESISDKSKNDISNKNPIKNSFFKSISDLRAFAEALQQNDKISVIKNEQKDLNHYKDNISKDDCLDILNEESVGLIKVSNLQIIKFLIQCYLNHKNTKQTTIRNMFPIGSKRAKKIFETFTRFPQFFIDYLNDKKISFKSSEFDFFILNEKKKEKKRENGLDLDKENVKKESKPKNEIKMDENMIKKEVLSRFSEENDISLKDCEVLAFLSYYKVKNMRLSCKSLQKAQHIGWKRSKRLCKMFESDPNKYIKYLIEEKENENE